MLSRSRHDELSRRNEGRQLLSPHLNPPPEGEEEFALRAQADRMSTRHHPPNPRFFINASIFGTRPRKLR